MGKDPPRLSWERERILFLIIKMRGKLRGEGRGWQEREHRPLNHIKCSGWTGLPTTMYDDDVCSDGG